MARAGFEKAGAFQSMEERVERAGADAVAVVGELFHHGQAEDGFMARVQQHVDANEAGIELALRMVHRNQYSAAAEFAAGEFAS